MVRSFALLALPLLLAGCGSASKSADSAPPPTIDSVRSSYFGQQPSASSQVAATPQPIPAEQAKAAPPLETADQPGDASEPSQAAASAHKPAGPPYKATVAAYIKRYAVDSSSLKLAKIGTPFEGAVNGQKGSVVCVELGGMSGNRTAYLLKDNNVVDSEFGAASCRDRKLQPWDNAGA